MGWNRKKKTILANLSSESNRKVSSLCAIKKAVKNNSRYKNNNKPYPSAEKSRILKEWRDGWFGKE